MKSSEADSGIVHHSHHLEMETEEKISFRRAGSARDRIALVWEASF